MKKHKLTKVWAVISVCIISAICGFFSGNLISKLLFPSNTLNIDPKELMDDPKLINYENKTPDQLSGTQVFLVAYHKLEQSNNYKFYTTGKIETSVGVNQTTKATRSKNGNNYFYEFATYSSMIKTANRIKFTPGEDIIIEVGAPTDDTLNIVNYNGKTKSHSYEEFHTLIGRDPKCTTGYLVSSKTVLSCSPCTIENDTYTYTLNLIPKLGGILSKHEISYVSGVDVNAVEFLSIEITFTVDKNFNLMSQTAIDQYKMQYAGIGVIVCGTCTTLFN